MDGPRRAVVGVEARGDVVGAAWDQVAGEVVRGGAQGGEVPAVQGQQRDAAA
ncbi:hypothetical protein HEP87_59925 [Streptomyces sp. S1D4-11]